MKMLSKITRKFQVLMIYLEMLIRGGNMISAEKSALMSLRDKVVVALTHLETFLDSGK